MNFMPAGWASTGVSSSGLLSGASMRVGRVVHPRVDSLNHEFAGEFPTPFTTDARSFVRRENQQVRRDQAQLQRQRRQARSLAKMQREAADDQRVVPVG